MGSSSSHQTGRGSSMSEEQPTIVAIDAIEQTGSTRRKFIKWTAAGSIGASALLGSLVGFTPTAQALRDFNCRNVFNCFQSCLGTCEPFQSCCRMNISGPDQFCCCTCHAGPYKCQPATFRARSHCTGLADQCCCTTCV